MQKYKNFDHRLLDFFKNYNFTDIYLACSGGVDSVSLLHSLCKIKKQCGFSISLLHVHHGESDQHIRQSEFRQKSLDLCQALSLKYQINFEFIKSDKFLNTEEECRNFRVQFLKNYPNVIFAHHQDDYMETLLLRMIRGVGARGFTHLYKAHKNFYYPFLHTFNKTDILAYAQEEGIEYIQDPSDKNVENLRSWLRVSFLQELDKKMGRGGLYKSLENIQAELLTLTQNEIGDHEIKEPGKILVTDWLRQNKFQKSATIARLLHKLKKTGYTKGQVNEIIKLLDKEDKNLEFELAGLKWTKTSLYIQYRLL